MLWEHVKILYFDSLKVKYYLDTRFSTLDEQVEEVKRQILELQFQREDSPSF